MIRGLLHKLKALLYGVVLFFAIIARVVDCFFQAVIESRLVSLSFFVECYKFNWNDGTHYTSIESHVKRILELWNYESI